MYYIFKNEVKRKFKNPVLWIMILIMIILLYINIERSYEANEIDIILNYQPGIIEQGRDESYLDNSSITFDDRHSDSFNSILSYNFEVGRKAYFNHDLVKLNEISSFNNLLHANLYANSIENRDDVLSKYLCQIANEELWDKVSDGTKYEDIDFSNNGRFNLYNVISGIFEARYYYYLSINNLDVIEKNEFNNLYVLYNWITEIIPILVVVVTILLSYDLINKDVKEGSTKLLITQSIPRWKYYIGKFFATVIVVLFVIMLPLTIFNIYLKFNVKSQPINYPIVYDNQGLKKIKPSFNYMEENLKKYEKYEQIAFYKIPYSKVDSSQFKWPLYQRNIDLIGFDKFLLLTFFYNLLFIIFVIAFIQLISAIFNNVIVSLFATVGIYGGFYYLFRPFLHGKHYNLCPFTMNNSARIVAGTHNVTMLTAAIILISSAILFLVIGLKYFKVKEI